MQIKNQLDDKTVEKIIKGLGYSFLGGLQAFVSSYIATNYNFKLSILVALGTILLPFSANAVVQYRKGEEPGN